MDVFIYKLREITVATIKTRRDVLKPSNNNTAHQQTIIFQSLKTSLVATMSQPTDNDMHTYQSVHCDHTTHTYQHISQQYSTIYLHDTSVDSANNDVHNGSSLRNIASSDSASSRAAARSIGAHNCPDYLQLLGNDGYLQPVNGKEHCQAAEVGMQSVNLLDNTSDQMQAPCNLLGYTMQDSTHRFLSTHYVGVQNNTSPVAQPTLDKGHYHEIADEHAVYEEINMEYQQARGVQASSADNTVGGRSLQQDQHEEHYLQPVTDNQDRHSK